MRTNRGPKKVVDARRVRNPHAQSLIDRRPQSLVARLHGDHLGAEPTHAVDVRRLPLDIDGAHVDTARQTDPGAGRRRRDAVLPGARLGDDALDAEPLREQRLADRIVDLVCARVCEILALEPHLGAPALAELWRKRQRRRPANPLAKLSLKLLLEIRVVQELPHAIFESLERRNQGFRHVTPAERSETASLVRKLSP